MTRTLTTGMQAASPRTFNRLVTIVELATDLGFVRAWSGVGDLPFNGQTFLGVGTFGSVSPTDENLDLSAEGIQLSLSGIPSSMIATALTDVRQGRKCSIWYGIIKDSVKDNYVTNGFFDSDISGWIKVGHSISWNPNGWLDVTDSDIADSRADQQLSGLDITKEYILTYEVKDFGAQGPQFQIGTTQGGFDILDDTANDRTLGLHKLFFTPTVSNPWILVRAFGSLTNDTVSIDNIVIIENEPVSLINDPVLIFEGETDSVTINEGSESSQIVINVENRLLRLEKTNLRRYTKQDQARLNPNDLGLDYVESIQDKEIKWGRS
jgi:hypothetical protein